jgi:osmotically-inducible protein OsmY
MELIELENNFPRFIMKTTFFYTYLIAALFSSAAVVSAQSSGAASTSVGGTSATTVSPTPVAPNTTTTPGVRVLQPRTFPQAQVTATSTMTAVTNNIGATTNGFPGTNGLAGVSNNASSVTATVNPVTNGFVNTNTEIGGNTVIGDQAVTPSDRILLTTISQGVKATLGITPNGNLPVHFMINNGTVTVVGTVQSSEQSQSILSQVQQTPGVATVISDLRVASPLGVAQSQVAPNSVFAGPTDHAFSAADQTLLTTVQQEAAMQLGITSSAQMPVHFSIQNGVVGVTGRLSSLQEKQALLAAIGRTRGIVRVVDNVAVINGAAGMSLNPGSGAVNNNNLQPTARPTGSNTMFLNSTNASGF